MSVKTRRPFRFIRFRVGGTAAILQKCRPFEKAQTGGASFGRVGRAADNSDRLTNLLCFSAQYYKNVAPAGCFAGPAFRPKAGLGAVKDSKHVIYLEIAARRAELARALQKRFSSFCRSLKAGIRNLQPAFFRSSEPAPLYASRNENQTKFGGSKQAGIYEVNAESAIERRFYDRRRAPGTARKRAAGRRKIVKSPFV